MDMVSHTRMFFLFQSIKNNISVLNIAESESTQSQWLSNRIHVQYCKRIKFFKQKKESLFLSLKPRFFSYSSCN